MKPQYVRFVVSPKSFPQQNPSQPSIVMKPERPAMYPQNSVSSIRFLSTTSTCNLVSTPTRIILTPVNPTSPISNSIELPKINENLSQKNLMLPPLIVSPTRESISPSSDRTPSCKKIKTCETSFTKPFLGNRKKIQRKIKTEEAGKRDESENVKVMLL